MKNGDLIIDDFLKPLEEIAEAIRKEQKDVQTSDRDADRHA